MKKCLLILVVLSVLIACKIKSVSNTEDTKNLVTTAKKISDTVRIANQELEYEVLIYEPGFGAWLASKARPRDFYSESYLKNRNQTWVQAWNARVIQPQKFHPNLYEMPINYDFQIEYGYEVNYLIYNYLVFFQQTYNQNLGGFFAKY